MEVVHHIFRLASARSRHACLDICLVASWAHHIALPYLFDTVMIKDLDTYSKFKKYVDPPVKLEGGFLPSAAVSGVWMEEGTRYPHHRNILTVFEACDNATHLALQLSFFYWLVRSSSPRVDLQEGENRVSRRALARNQDIHLTILDAQSFNWALREYHEVYAKDRSPIFDKVTHIRLTSIISYKTNISIDHFSRLSHLSLPYYRVGHHIAKHLEPLLELNSLKMLVIAVAKDTTSAAHWKRLEKWVHKTRKMDNRVYLIERYSCYFRDEWEGEVRGGKSIWDEAVQYTDDWEGNYERSG
jgi:hypothetical protein